MITHFPGLVLTHQYKKWRGRVVNKGNNNITELEAKPLLSKSLTTSSVTFLITVFDWIQSKQ